MLSHEAVKVKLISPYIINVNSRQESTWRETTKEYIVRLEITQTSTWVLHSAEKLL